MVNFNHDINLSGRTGMKAFVTGGTGFIGGRLIDRLQEKGYAVTALMWLLLRRMPKSRKARKG
jgi:NAD dependent epimerase/dehydratase family enzyme